MIEYFPLLIAVFGFLVGLSINILIEKLYIYREILSEEEMFFKNNGWVKFLLWPWGIKNLDLFKKIRIYFIEFIFIIISLWLWYSPPAKVEYFWGFPLLIYFSVVVVIDFEYKLIFKQISMIGVIIGFFLGIYLHDIPQTILGGLVGYGLMLSMYKMGELYIKRLSRISGEDIDEVALGFGDVYIAGIIGLILGWPGVLIGLFIGIFAGGVISFLIIIYKKIRGQNASTLAIPYAPFLIFGVVVLLYFKTWIS